MPDVPYFSEDELKKLNRSSVALSEALKTRNGNSEENIGNPLTQVHEDILAGKLTVLQESPVFYQVLFIAADRGFEQTLMLLDEICTSLKEDTDD